MPSRSRIFISYSHEDRAIAERLARSLLAAGQDVWWDQWEIAAGDSLVQKIFTEGLANAGAFIVLLSPSSLRSKWVHEELDTATVRRIEDVTRVIPVLVGDVPVPAPLRTLRWLDLRADFDAAVRQIVNAMHGFSEKPPLGQVPRHLTTLSKPIPGLSKAATTVATRLLSVNDPDEGQDHALAGKEIADALSLEPEEVNDAVAELEELGLVTVIRTLGTNPYDFAAIEPSYLLYTAAADSLGYDPEDDIKVVLATVASMKSIDGPGLREKTSLSPGRLNRAVDHIRDHGLAEVLRYLGTHPFSFGRVHATSRTRQATSRA